jgi:hypothetical protein
MRSSGNFLALSVSNRNILWWGLTTDAEPGFLYNKLLCQVQELEMLGPGGSGL